MSEKFRELQKRIVEELHTASYPDFVISNEVNNRFDKIGDYKIQYAPEWSRGLTYFKFQFDKGVKWNYKESKELSDIVKKYPSDSDKNYPRYDIIQPKIHDKYVELALKHTPVTRDMLYNHFLVFDMMEYEKGGLEEMLKVAESNYEDYYDPYSEAIPKSREETELWLIERLSAAINSDSITVNNTLLANCPALLEEIGGKFFGAKIE